MVWGKCEKVWGVTVCHVRTLFWHETIAFLRSQGLIVMMSVLCTMTGVLGISGKFPTGPPGWVITAMSLFACQCRQIRQMFVARIPSSPMQAIQIQMMPSTMIASWSLWAGLISSWVLQVPIFFNGRNQDLTVEQANNKPAASWVKTFLKVPVHFESLDECEDVEEMSLHDHLTEAEWSEVFEISL